MYYLIRFWRNSVENCYFGKFSLKISDVFFQGQTLFWPYLRNGWSDVKRKGSALVGYWVQYMTLTFDFTHDLDLGCFKVKFRNSSISGIVGLIDVKWKGSELIWYWADCMTLPFDHTRDLDLGVSRSESEMALSHEWGGRLTMNEKDVSHPFMTMILTCVTMVWWADVPDSDWGDFRSGVDISSLWKKRTCLSCIVVPLLYFQDEFFHQKPQRGQSAGGSHSARSKGSKSGHRPKAAWQVRRYTLETSNAFNSLSPGRCGNNFKSIDFKLIKQNTRLGSHNEISLSWMKQNLINEKSTLVQVMAWWRQATSY